MLSHHASATNFHLLTGVKHNVISLKICACANGVKQCLLQLSLKTICLLQTLILITRFDWSIDRPEPVIMHSPSSALQYTSKHHILPLPTLFREVGESSIRCLSMFDGIHRFYYIYHNGCKAGYHVALN